MGSCYVLGKPFIRKESKDKVTGRAKYTNDFSQPGLFHGRLVLSPYAHARILKIDTSKALELPGVKNVITGKFYPHPSGVYIKDRYPVAVDKVRYFGEVVAIVIGENEFVAKKAAELVKVQYEPLEVINSPSEALKSTAPLIHENLDEYKRVEDVYPHPGTNIANHTKIRKGDIKSGWLQSDIVVEKTISFPDSDHAAMETRCAAAEILPDGKIVIESSTQAPFDVKKIIAEYFNISPGKVSVNVPLVGGAYGGKTPVTLEYAACLASMAVGGRKVKIVNTREEDMITSPCHIGLEAKIRLGSTRNGVLKAAEIVYLFDGGAFSDNAVRVSRAAAQDCTGPYKVDNVRCDSLCIYTNHPYATAFRGFGHTEETFVIERAMDILAKKLNMDPLELRLKNAIMPGDTSPTGTFLAKSNIGNLPECIKRLKELINWDKNKGIRIEGNMVRSWGISCFWKTSSSPTDAGAGAVITFNTDGSLNLNCAAVEIGQGTRTGLTLILAEKFKMDPERINISMEVSTDTSPEHWKTVASTATLLNGNAALKAADDAIRQLKEIAAIPLRANPEELEVGFERVYIKSNPKVYIAVKDVAMGYEYPNGNTVGKKVIGRGSYILTCLSPLDQETGRGDPGHEWSVAAQAVEVEFDSVQCTYKVLNAATVVDAGRIINSLAARGQITGGMAMGLSFGSREEFIYDDNGIVENPTLRLYKIARFGEHPKYIVNFVETPYEDGPYGERGIGEHGVIGMPAALASSLSMASGTELDFLPLVPEKIWRARKEQENDSI